MRHGTQFVCIVRVRLVLLASLLCLPARANFVNGVENFDGTTIDTNTWEVTQLNYGRVTQNNTLNFSVDYLVQGCYADVTTRTVQIPVGGSARVEFSPVAIPVGWTFGKVYMLLTSNTAASNQQWYFNSYSMGLELGFDAAHISAVTDVFWQPHTANGDIGYSDNLPDLPPNPLNRHFAMQVKRRSLLVAEFTIFDGIGGTLAHMISGVAPENGQPPPEFLNITLAGFGTVNFDNLSITPVIPEPACAATCAAGLLLCQRRRTHSHNRQAAGQ